jgi:CheY-like chemotaxis protein
MHIMEEHLPDVILLDLVMPNMDGFQLLERRKQEPAWQNVPVMLISARDPEGQPIVSRDLSVKVKTGLTVAQLLASIRSLSKILAPASQVDDPVRSKAHPDSLVSE